MNGRRPIAAVVVTFQPDAGVQGRLAAVCQQVERLIVVDNDSGEPARTLLRNWAESAGAVFIANAENRGLAAALNQGMRRAEDEGFEWVVTLDQDSTPQPGMVAALARSVLAAPKPERVAIVGANTVDERRPEIADRWLLPGHWHMGFRRAACRGADLPNVTFVITSGSLTRVRTWRELGGFDEGLFIDFIDHDFCLKAHRIGLEVRVGSDARLLHNMGAKRAVKVAGRRLCPTFHSATRHYYMARNRILVWRRHAWRYPHWWMFDVCFSTLNSVRVFLAEDRRREKMAAMLRGTRDGLLGRRGREPQR
jgi:rhamnosyltransferase